MTRLDHLVLVVPDLETAADRIREEWGCQVHPGGRHPEWGSWNALIPLRGGAYLELIAPDPEASGPRARIFSLERVRSPGLATWAVRPGADAGQGREGAPPEPESRPRPRTLEDLVSAARAAGVELGALYSGRRRTREGKLLGWVLSDPFAPRLGGVVPFVIDWGSTPHPSEGAQIQVELLRLQLGHPDPQRVRKALVALGAHRLAEVTESPAPEVRARLRTPGGEVEVGASGRGGVEG